MVTRPHKGKQSLKGRNRIQIEIQWGGNRKKLSRNAIDVVINRAGTHTRAGR